MMNSFHIDIEHISDTYIWHSGLTIKQSRDIERVQQVVLYIMMGESFTNYDVACTLVNIEPLNIRWEQLCLKFAQKNVKQDNSFFTKIIQPGNTRSKPKTVVKLSIAAFLIFQDS